MEVQIRHSDSPIQGHFIINDSERSRQHTVQPTADGPEYVAFGWKHVATIIVALMQRIEAPKNDMDKAMAEAQLDAICALVGSHGVITNLPKIRVDLCSDCAGLGAPSQAIINADVVAKADAGGASVGKHPVTTGV